MAKNKITALRNIRLAKQLIESEEPNSTGLKYLFRVLDMAPWVLAMFPELKADVLEIAKIAQKEINDFVKSLDK